MGHSNPGVFESSGREKPPDLDPDPGDKRVGSEPPPVVSGSSASINRARRKAPVVLAGMGTIGIDKPGWKKELKKNKARRGNNRLVPMEEDAEVNDNEDGLEGEVSIQEENLEDSMAIQNRFDVLTEVEGSGTQGNRSDPDVKIVCDESIRSSSIEIPTGNTAILSRNWEDRNEFVNSPVSMDNISVVVNEFVNSNTNMIVSSDSMGKGEENVTDIGIIEQMKNRGEARNDDTVFIDGGGFCVSSENSGKIAKG